MSMSTNIHRATKAEAVRVNTGTSWLTFSNDNDCHVTIYMPFETAQTIADIFNAAQSDAKAVA